MGYQERRHEIVRASRTAIVLLGAWTFAAAAGAGELPAGLASPDHGVVCNAERGAC